MRLKGKVAIVTGAGSGFGEGIARAYVNEGAKVIVADLSGDRARAVLEELGPNAAAIEGDVSRGHDVLAMVDAALSVFGVIAGGMLFGPIGLIFASPLLVVAMVLVKRLWVEEVLHTPTHVPGRDPE